MANLTPAQKECIASIERQFMAINKINNDIPYNVVNVNVLNAEFNRRKIAKSEFDIHNDGMRKVRISLRDKLCEKLNADFEAGNINLEAKDFGYDAIIRKKGDKYGDNKVYVYLIEVTEGHEFGNKTIDFVYSGESESQSSGIKCKTAEELFATPQMQKRMIWIMEKSR